MIIPTIGRVVWFQPAKNADAALREQPFAALVAYVHNERCVNLGGFDQNGVPFNAGWVTLLQDDDPAPVGGHFAQWMPYQQAMAAKAAV